MGERYPYFIAAVSKDISNLMSSSSGGIFFELGKIVLSEGGAVYGAVQLNSCKVKHKRAITLDELKTFRGSKYLRSDIKMIYKQVETDLKNGLFVLFSGTGCQIGGLYTYLKVKYDNLLTCEVVCHGAPINQAMMKFLEEREKVIDDKISVINYRDKCNGWKDNHITECYISGRKITVSSIKHPVHSLYLLGINMDRGCSFCKYAKLPRVSDITLADYWQYNGELCKENRDRGISLVAINSDKGQIYLKKMSGNILFDFTTKEEALNSCRHMNNAPLCHPSQSAFRKLLSENSFGFSYSLCNRFGEVRLASELHLIKTLDIKYIYSVFEKDTQEVIYVIDKENKLVGVITFGAFIRGYGKNEQYVNYNFKKAGLSEGCIEQIASLFLENENINRIPVIDSEGRIYCEVRRLLGGNGKEDIRKRLLPFSEMTHRKIKCYYIKRPDLLENKVNYNEKEKRRIDNGLSFPVMQNKIQEYWEDFKDIYGIRVETEYVQALCKIPPIVRIGDYYRHVDGMSQLVNVINGKRVTCNQPDEYMYNIHIYGRCGVFGYAVEDADTLPSLFQKIANENGEKARVINHGLWGADDEKILSNMSMDLKNGLIKREDVVILYMDYPFYADILKYLPIKICDITQPFHEILKNDEVTFFDRPGHMNANGYKFVAEYMYKQLKADGVFNENKYYLKNTDSKIDNNYSINIELNDYITNIYNMLISENIEKKSVGSIVMNCNPFTLGHRYLIEQAQRQVDILILFVLEEDKSFFKFEDRINMVKIGTRDMKNVYVFPSGKFMISSYTFPEYFIKENNQDIVVDVTNDVELFGRYIAPRLNITKRFVGTEPEDKITDQYNIALKKMLPEYGIQLVEISRLKIDDDVVTATLIRKYIKEKNLSAIKKYLMEDVWDYLSIKE